MSAHLLGHRATAAELPQVKARKANGRCSTWSGTVRYLYKQGASFLQGAVLLNTRKGNQIVLEYVTLTNMGDHFHYCTCFMGLEGLSIKK